VCAVRQVIPIIRSNDTRGTPDIDYSRHGRSAGDEDVGAFFKQPEHAQRTYRAAKRVRKDVLESRILEKKLRFLRAVGLRELETKRKRRKRYVPRISYPVRIDQVTKKKVSFVPRYFTAGPMLLIIVVLFPVNRGISYWSTWRISETWSCIFSALSTSTILDALVAV